MYRVAKKISGNTALTTKDMKMNFIKNESPLKTEFMGIVDNSNEYYTFNNLKHGFLIIIKRISAAIFIK